MFHHESKFSKLQSLKTESGLQNYQEKGPLVPLSDNLFQISLKTGNRFDRNVGSPHTLLYGHVRTFIQIELECYTDTSAVFYRYTCSFIQIRLEFYTDTSEVLYAHIWCLLPTNLNFHSVTSEVLYRYIWSFIQTCPEFYTLTSGIIYRYI